MKKVIAAFALVWMGVCSLIVLILMPAGGAHWTQPSLVSLVEADLTAGAVLAVGTIVWWWLGGREAFESNKR